MPSKVNNFWNSQAPRHSFPAHWLDLWFLPRRRFVLQNEISGKFAYGFTFHCHRFCSFLLRVSENTYLLIQICCCGLAYFLYLSTNVDRKGLETSTHVPRDKNCETSNRRVCTQRYNSGNNRFRKKNSIPLTFCNGLCNLSRKLPATVLRDKLKKKTLHRSNLSLALILLYVGSTAPSAILRAICQYLQGDTRYIYKFACNMHCAPHFQRRTHGMAGNFGRNVVITPYTRTSLPALFPPSFGREKRWERGCIPRPLLAHRTHPQESARLRTVITVPSLACFKR